MLSVASETSATYVLVTPNGFRAVFNDNTDPDYVGGLTEVTGFDSPEVREEAEVKPQADGGLHGKFFFGRRPMTMTGKLTNQPTMIQRTNVLAKLQAAVLDCAHSDATLYWTISNGQQVFMNVRVQQALRISGAWVKEFQIALVASDPRIYAVDQSYVVQGKLDVVDPEDNRILQGRGGDQLNYVIRAGFGFPIKFPLAFNQGRPVSGIPTYPEDCIQYSVVATNNGSTDTEPIISITGPLTNASNQYLTFRNVTTQKALVLQTLVPLGQTLKIDFKTKEIMLDGVSIYASMDPVNSDWWSLAPGDNRITVQAPLQSSLFSPDQAPSVQVAWQNAWL